MSWDKILIAIITLAIIALIVSSPATEQLVAMIGRTIAGLAKTVVGTPGKMTGGTIPGTGFSTGGGF
jgi:hypothetical protein